MTSARPIAIILIAWTEDSSVIPALASGNFLLYRTCPLSGVERTKIDGQLRLRLRRNDFCKYSRRSGARKTRWGKQWGKQIAARCS
jgi:hypothetical protein